jgi:hypothetical protein
MNPPTRNTLQMSLPIRPWLSVRFNQRILVRPPHQAEHSFREAHRDGGCNAPVRSGTLAAVPHAGGLLHSDNRSHKCALPHRFGPEENGLLDHTTP